MRLFAYPSLLAALVSLLAALVLLPGAGQARAAEAERFDAVAALYQLLTGNRRGSAKVHTQNAEAYREKAERKNRGARRAVREVEELKRRGDATSKAYERAAEDAVQLTMVASVYRRLANAERLLADAFTHPAYRNDPTLRGPESTKRALIRRASELQLETLDFALRSGVWQAGGRPPTNFYIKSDLPLPGTIPFLLHLSATKKANLPEVFASPTFGEGLRRFMRSPTYLKVQAGLIPLLHAQLEVFLEPRLGPLRALGGRIRTRGGALLKRAKPAPRPWLRRLRLPRIRLPRITRPRLPGRSPLQGSPR